MKVLLDGGGVSNGEVKDDLRPFVGRAFYLDPATMNLDDILNNGESQAPKTFIGMGAEKRFTDPLHQVRRDAGAVILDGDGDGVMFRCGMGSHGDASAIRHGFQGILGQIEQGGLNAIPVHVKQRHMLIHVDHELNARFLHQRFNKG